MPVKREIVSAFLGKGLLAVKLKKQRILIDFGEIYFPFSKAILDARDELESKYNCKVVDRYAYVSIIPSPAIEWINRNGALCTADEGCKEMLSEWLIENFLSLVKDLVGILGGQ